MGQGGGMTFFWQFVVMFVTAMVVGGMVGHLLVRVCQKARGRRQVVSWDPAQGGVHPEEVDGD